MADKSHTYSIHSDNNCKTGIPSNSLTRFLNAVGEDPCPRGEILYCTAIHVFLGATGTMGEKLLNDTAEI